MLLMLGGLLVWMPAQAGAQVFAINPINNITNLVGTAITIQISVTNTTGAASQLTWNLVSNPATPSATIAPVTTGPLGPTTFSWTPTQAEVVIFTVSVSQLSTTNTAGASFVVTVTNAFAPGIVIDTIPAQTVAEGATLVFTNHAHATDNTNNTLVFSLLNAPSGATMTNDTPTSGVFSWTPTSAQAATPSYTIREIVTEAVTSGSNYQDFLVTVTRTNNCAQLDEFLAAVQQGGYFLLSNCTTIVLSNTLTISSDTILDADTNNVTITGNGLLRLFTVQQGVTFTLRGLTLSGGQATNGGGLYISPGAIVVLTNCTLQGNQAAGSSGVDGTDGSTNGVDGGNGGNGTAGGRAFGGAIYNLGSFAALSCQFLTNSASGGTGGAGGSGGNGSGTLSHGGNGGNGGNGALGYGGAIYSEGSLWLSNCTFAGNSATGGSGGVAGTNGTATGTGAVAGMPGTGGAGAAGSGAAVYSTNNAIILDCTFSGNVAQGGDGTAGGTDSAGNGVSGTAGANSFGGGVCNLSAGFLTNCTFSSNQVAGGAGGTGGNGKGVTRSGGNGGNGGNGLGGGLYNAGNIVVVNCTFSGGSAVGGTNGLAGTGNSPGASNGSLGVGKGGDVANGAGSFVLRNSILGASSAGTNAYDTSASRITDGGYNISSDASLNLSGTSLKNTDPQLGSLASNGGPTQTMALGTNSPALDRIPASLCPATDQRGVPRPQGSACDVGAYELVTLPAILSQPQSQTNAIGTSVTFSVSALGGSLGYQWRFNSAAIASSGTASSYAITSVGATNAGSYDVVITNSYGSVTSAVANLTVLVPPAITTQPSNQTAVVGSSVSFSVTATGTAPLTYQWALNGTNLAGATTDPLQLTNVQLNQAGSYAVMVANEAGSTNSTTATLTVTYPPVILSIQPTNPSVPVGSAAAFVVSAVGAEPLAYQWQFNGANIANATSSSYTVVSAQTTNAGMYAVVVSNIDGSLTSAPVTLTVYALPHIAVQPDGSVQLALAVTSTCRVQGSTNLANWQTLFTTNDASADAVLEFTDTNAANLPMRFYRVGQALDGHPVLTNFLATNQAVSLDCIAAPIQACQIEASTDLTSWATIFTSNLTPAVPFQFRYTDTTNLPMRFYRLSQTPGF
jgi:hypothetical protein